MAYTIFSGIIISKKIIGEIQEMHKEITIIRKKLGELEEITLSSEKIPERKLNELRKLRTESNFMERI